VGVLGVLVHVQIRRQCSTALMHVRMSVGGGQQSATDTDSRGTQFAQLG
jgi:hypothetical protein